MTKTPKYKRCPENICKIRTYKVSRDLKNEDV